MQTDSEENKTMHFCKFNATSVSAERLQIHVLLQAQTEHLRLSWTIGHVEQRDRSKATKKLKESTGKPT